MISFFLRRKMELFLAVYTLVYGLWLMRSAHSMDGPGFRLIVHIASEQQWGALFFFNGLSHILALLVNGKRWLFSSLVRWFATLTSASVYAAMAYLFWLVDPDTTAVPNYGLLSLGACACMITVWLDARTYQRINYAVVAHA